MAARGKPRHLPLFDSVTRAYLAGLIDGEGCIGIYARKPTGTRRVEYHQLQVIVGMGDAGPIEFMAEQTHSYGSLKYHKATKTGHIYEVRLHGQRAAAFLEQVAPFLKGKRAQAELGIAFYHNCYFSKTNQVVTAVELEQRRSYELALKEMKHAHTKEATHA